jgi:hypothetical protein
MAPRIAHLLEALFSSSDAVAGEKKSNLLADKILGDFRVAPGQPGIEAIWCSVQVLHEHHV